MTNFPALTRSWKAEIVSGIRGGICGSDLHYFLEGGIGGVSLQSPIIPGHEAAGIVKEVGPGVDTLAKGDVVAINPAKTCGTCDFCRSGQSQQCGSMRFMGSILSMPHVDGLFRTGQLIDAARCAKFSDRTDVRDAAFTEPLAVCLYALRQSGDVTGKTCLVTGAGPIGSLTVSALKAAGAAEIWVSDVARAALERTGVMGATRLLDVSKPQQTRMAETVDCVFECSAAPAAIELAIEAVKWRVTIVLVGVGGVLPFQVNRIIAEEVTIRGSQRFADEFIDAAQAIDNGVIDPRPALSYTFPLP